MNHGWMIAVLFSLLQRSIDLTGQSLQVLQALPVFLIHKCLRTISQASSSDSNVPNTKNRSITVVTNHNQPV